MSIERQARRAAVLLAVGLAAVACGHDPAGPRVPPPAGVAIVAGDSQRVRVGEPVPVAPTVVVRDAAGRPVAEAQVTFTITHGDGQLRDSVVRTDAAGIARVGRWTLGPVSTWQTLVASVPGVRAGVTFLAFSDPGAPVVLRVVLGDAQTALTGTEVSAPIVVHAEDRFGNPVFGDQLHLVVPPPLPTPPVTVETAPGDSAAVVVDSRTGDLRVAWRLSYTTGMRRLTVRVGDLTTTVTATATIPPYTAALASTVALVARMLDSVTGPAVQVVDAAGRPRAGVAVQVRVLTGEGRVVPALGDQPTSLPPSDSTFTVTTDSYGRAHTGVWTLGPRPGGQILRVEVTGLPAIDLTATATGTLVPLRATALSAGSDVSCALAPDGVIDCWGSDLLGALGSGTATWLPVVLPRPVRGAPVTPPVTPPFTALATAGLTSCGLTAAGQPSCWGAALPQSTGVYTAWPQATAIGGAPPLRQLVVGTGVACGLTGAGAAWCWGDNDRGQLGDGTRTARPAAVPVGNAPPFAAVALSAGGSFGCGLPADGQPLCWGTLPDTGTADRGTPRTRLALVPSPIAAGPALVALATGAPLCGLTADGIALCRATVADAPTLVGDAVRFTRLASSGVATCGVATSGALWCWGRNDDGQLGDGTTTSRSTPAPVTGGLRFADVAVGVRHTCGLTTDGAVYCWGAGASGQLATGLLRPSAVPRRAILRVDP